ncbi:MAG: hypothetical protein KatS3mg031_1477 [Chitinophagales bacterium]|nr:MAG: hypothetical protein KatS3mg031_1477 [Chitinophagales bacterium]
MNSKILMCVCALLPAACWGQFWPGYETGRFSGTSSANVRPASMAPNPYKIDATLGAVHLFAHPQRVFSRDAAAMIFTGGFRHLYDFSKLSSPNMLVISNLQGPSVLATVNPKTAIAFTWNMRFLWASRLSAPGLSALFDTEAVQPDINESNARSRIFFSGWNEYCLGASAQIWKKTYHSLAIGGFVKIITGTADMRMHLKNTSVQTSGSKVSQLNTDMEITVSDQVISLVDDGRPNMTGHVGVGFDVGMAYRFENPRSCPGASNHRLKLGFSLTDIGFARYTRARAYKGQGALMSEIPLEAIRQTSLEQSLDTVAALLQVNSSATGEEYRLLLPMSLRVHSEVNLGKRLLVYGEFHFLFTQLTDPQMPLVFRFNLTPRFEDYQWGVYLPLTFTNYLPASAGLALRWKPFIIGSGNLFSFWAYPDRDRALDIFVAIKIPIVQDNERIDYRAWKR